MEAHSTQILASEEKSTTTTTTGHNRRKSQYLHFIYLQLITNTLRGVHQAYSKRLKGGGSFFLTCKYFEKYLTVHFPPMLFFMWGLARAH